MSKKIKLYTALSLLLTSLSAHAQWAVIDPTNLIQNTVQATKGILTETNTATSAIQNTKQTIQMVRSLTSLGGIAKLAGLENELRLYSDLKATNDGLSATMKEASTLGADIKARMGASNFSWKTYAQTVANNDAARAQNFMDRLQMMNNSVEKSNTRRKEILGQLAASDGSIVAASQATTLSVDNVASQLGQLVNAQAAVLADQGMAAKTKSDNLAVQDAMWNSHLKAQQQTVDKYKRPYTPPKM